MPNPAEGIVQVDVVFDTQSCEMRMLRRKWGLAFGAPIPGFLSKYQSTCRFAPIVVDDQQALLAVDMQLPNPFAKQQQGQQQTGNAHVLATVHIPPTEGQKQGKQEGSCKSI